MVAPPSPASHPHALAAATAAEDAALQDLFWEMHELLFHRQKALEDDDLQGYAGEVRGTPTLFIDGVVHLGGYDAATLAEALAR